MLLRVLPVKRLQLPMFSNTPSALLTMLLKRLRQLNLLLLG
jgi:hypothetical protein